MGDHGQAHRHGLDHRDPEALVLGGDHEHVGAGHGGHQIGIAQRAAEPYGVVQSHLVDEAEESRRVGGHHGPPDDLEGGCGVAVGAGDQERHHRVLDALVGGEAPHADPARTGPRTRTTSAVGGSSRRASSAGA